MPDSPDPALPAATKIPLPTPPTPTADQWGQMVARVERLCVLVEIVSKHSDGFDDRLVRVENAEKRLTQIARDLDHSSQELSKAMRNLTLQRFAPAPVLLVVAILAGLAGGAAVEATHRHESRAPGPAPTATP